ncbi:alpha/beta hydrolase [Roseovarius sp. LXJ103]|uniref:alpha/beta hydrolase n=1 Tax=Roseovarius carneus TaxID=2853164 RepID=UPI000D60D6A4|nr:alpha/beta hydrolase [Roseovarius carneus]MBZ8118968.1 alpha/beta hydrolase [Roseovarius carneus]PWE35377.1 hypothetical protein DD563_05005 [Pelagicola sp. LXJ1103]
MTSLRRAGLFTALITILGAGGWLSLEGLERRAVYPFDATRISPTAAGIPAQEVLQSHGGVRHILWVTPPESGKPVILYLHGNAGNLANRAGRFEQFLERGYGLIAPAYRGSSGSGGIPSEALIAADMARLYGSLGDLIPGLAPADVILFGESLGSGVALRLIADTRQQPLGVVLEAPYTSLPDVVRVSAPQFTSLIPQMQNIWNSAEHAQSLTAPLMIIHGTQDTLIPVAQGRAVHAAAGSAAKQMIEVQAGGHNDLWRSDVLRQIWAFIDAQPIRR